MIRDPYTPGAVQVQAKTRNGRLLAIMIALGAGILSWLVFGYMVDLAIRFILIPVAEAGRWSAEYNTFLFSGTAVLVFVAFGATLGAIRMLNPWILWCAFIMGAIACVLAPVFFHGEGFALAVYVLGHSAFMTAAISSGTALLIVAWLKKKRPNTSLERTRGR